MIKKTLDVLKFGVQELGTNEMTNVEGGGFGPLGFGFRVWSSFSFYEYANQNNCA